MSICIIFASASVPLLGAQLQLFLPFKSFIVLTPDALVATICIVSGYRDAIPVAIGSCPSCKPVPV